MSDEFFKLAKDLVRTAYKQQAVKSVRYYCPDCDEEYADELVRCNRVIVPETDELFAEYCNGKIKTIED